MFPKKISRSPAARNFLRFVGALLMVTAFIPQNSLAVEPLKVYVVNYPLKYFAERVGGQYVNVVLPLPTGIDPAYWHPDINTILAFQQADLILLNGAGYAKWVDKASLPRSKVVNTSKKFKNQYITVEGVIKHSHGAAGEHAHEDIAFTTWLDFDLATKQAEAILHALVRKYPRQKEGFELRYQSLKDDLEKLDRNLKSIVSTDRSKPLIASHPVYDYLARRYDLNIKQVHWEPDEIPGDRQWIELGKILKAHLAEWMIWEGEPENETLKKLKKAGLKSLVYDPCANIPAKGDFLSIMQQNVESLKPAFR